MSFRYSRRSMNVVDLPFDFEKSSKAKIWTPSSKEPHRKLKAEDTAAPTTIKPSFQPTSFPTFNGVPVYDNCTAGDYGSSYCNNLTTIASPQLVSALSNINNNTGIPSVSQAVYQHLQTISIISLGFQYKILLKSTMVQKLVHVFKG